MSNANPMATASPADAVANAGQLDELRRSVAAFVERGETLKRSRANRDRLPGYDVEAWKEMARLGLLGIIVPEALGGLGLGAAELAVVAEELGRVLAPEPFVAAGVLATFAVASSENATLREHLLQGMLQGDLVAALAWQEGAGADPTDVHVQARKAGAVTRLSGRKCFVAGAGAATGFIVSARDAAGIALYWLPADAAGLTVRFDTLTDGRCAATLDLTDVAADRLAGPGKADAILAEALDLAMVATGAELLGVARRVFEMTLDYMRVRTQFGRLIGTYQALQHRAVDIWVRIELAAAVLAEAVAASGRGQSASERAASASRVKARCGDAALLATREAIQLHGAIGFTDECDVGLYVKRALTLSAWLGGVHWHRRRFARIVPISRRDAPSEVAWPGLERLRALPPDADWNALSDDDFRYLVRDFVRREYPPEFRFMPRRVRWHEVREWNLKLAARGWIAPAWPRSEGGMGLSPAKQLIYIDEFELGGVGRAPDQGVRQLGPALMRYGTPEQKRTWLPKILSCEHVWCQGYSEPNAGSDLASVTTTAVIDGDQIVIKGQKIWTSMAMDSTHIYVLCRTDKSVKKQAGLSFIIADLKTPGITVRPIRDIAGHEEFSQVFFDNVRVPADHLIGALNTGWSVAKAVLDFERLGIGSPHRPSIAFSRLTFLATQLNLFEDDGFLDEYTKLRLDFLDHTALYTRFADAASRGETLGPEASILKIWGMEMFQRISEFALDRAGAYGGLPGPFAIGDGSTDLMTPYYMSRLVTIGGGSSEVLRNVLAKRVLQLPT